MQCRQCQQENRSGAKFCEECGTPLTRSSRADAAETSSADLSGALRDALDREAATSEILRIIGTSPTDAQPIFEGIARSGVRLCGALGCAVFIVHGDMLHVAATHGIPPDRVARFRSQFPAPLVADRGSDSRSDVDAPRAVLERRIFHLADIENNPQASPEQVEMARLGGYRTRLMVPMVRGDKALGLIAITSRAATPFTDQQVALLQTFADQAVIAIENVRLFTELDARNRDLTATSQILQVISRSPTDVQPVFEAIADSAMRLFDALGVAVVRYDGELISMAAARGGAPGSAAVATDRFRSPHRPIAGFPPEQTVLTKTMHHVADVDTDPSCSDEFRRHAHERGFRSVLSMPMLRGGDPVGVIVVSRAQPGAYSTAEIELLHTFADQAVIAIENVRLFKELEARNKDLTEALEQQTATAEILSVISRSQTDVQPVFDTIVRSAARLCDGLFSTLFQFDGELLHIIAVHNTTPEALEALHRVYPARPTRALVAARAILERTVVHISDAELELESEQRAVARAVGWRSALIVPMLREGAPIGVITVGRTEVGPFSHGEIELLKTFADQAVIAIENVRLFKELEEKNRALTQAHAQVTETLEQQTATSEVLKVISRSAFDLEPVLETLIENAVRLCGASRGSVYRFDGNVLRHATSCNVSQETADFFDRNPIVPGRYSIAARVALDRRMQHIPDILADSDYTFAVHHVEPIRTALGVPMMKGDDLLGAFTIWKLEVQPFTDRQIELVTTFADQAVIAIENVRLFKELEARTAELTRSVGELTALGEISQVLSSTLDLETVLTTIVSRAVQLSGLDGGVVFEYDDGTEEFVHRAATETGGTLAEARRTTRVRRGEGMVGQTAITLEPAQVPDITEPGAYDSRLRGNLIESGVRAILAVPMVREGHLIGCLVVSRNCAGNFPAETVELLRTFGTQSALAIQNARLFHEIADKSRQLEAASRHKSEFLANMSHELRTPLNAIIGFSEVLAEKMFGDVNDKQAEYLQDILESGRHLLSLINDILDLSKIEAGRMELELADFNLPQAIQNAMILIRERAIRREIALHEVIEERVGDIRADERKVKQVLLNLLSNAIKFTPEGGRIEIRAASTDGIVEVSVTDTGVGIAPEDQETVFEEFRQVGMADKRAEGTGLGLALSRKFIELHGGQIRLTSQVGVGSTFTFTLPIR